MSWIKEAKRTKEENDEIENELMMGTPEFTGAIGTFPTFARSQNYYLNEVIPDLVNPALSRHARFRR